MFSRPVSSGWKPVPTSSRLPTRPRMTACPAVGVVIRVRSFRSVDFPAPLRPMTPRTSPCSTEKRHVLRAPRSPPRAAGVPSRTSRRAGVRRASREAFRTRTGADRCGIAWRAPRPGSSPSTSDRVREAWLRASKERQTRRARKTPAIAVPIATVCQGSGEPSNDQRRPLMAPVIGFNENSHW